MYRRSLAILTLAAMLFVSVGAVNALHHDDHGHDHHHANDCQICFLVQSVTIAIALSVALFIVYTNSPFTISLRPAKRPTRAGHGLPASPRAPPLA
jgi:hypothetical protein